MAKCTRRAAGLGRHIDDACEAVRAMGASRAGQGMRWKPWSPDQQPVPFDKEARARFGKEIRELGRPPEISPAGALRELLKSTDVYNLDRESTRRPYCADKVRVVRDGVVPRPLVALLSEEAGAALRDPWRFIVKSDAEMSLLRDEDYIEPYTDPFLKVKKNMLGLVRKLKDIGFVTFRRKRRARVGVFTVSRKDDMLRLVFDCRPANQLHRSPPLTELATPGAFAHLDLSDEWLGTDARGPSQAVGGATDLVDSFYQLGYDELAEFFALDVELFAEEIGITTVYDPDSQSHTRVEPNDAVYACLAVLPMG